MILLLSCTRTAALTIVLITSVACANAPSSVQQADEPLTPEQTFAKLQARIDSAQSLKVVFRFVADEEWNGSVQHSEVPATLFLKDGNRVVCSMEHTWRWLGGFRLVSDGNMSALVPFTKDTGGVKRGKTYPDIEKNLKRCLVLGGIIVPIPGSLWPWLFGSQMNGFADMCRLSELKQGPDEGAMKTLVFNLRGGPRKQDEVAVTLWYDPKSYVPRKRRYRYRVGGNDQPEMGVSEMWGVFTEIYDEFTFNADIPDEMFKLPEEKK